MLFPNHFDHASLSKLVTELSWTLDFGKTSKYHREYQGSPKIRLYINV